MFMKTGRIAIIFSIFFVFISYELAKSEGPLNSTSHERISFGIFTDLHYGLKDSGNRYCSDGDKRLTDIINTFNERNLPLAFMLGDYISSCQNEEQDKDKTIETLRDIDTIFKNFLGERHYVLGNHDLEYLTKSEWLFIIDRSNLNYYSFNMKGFHFVILDTMYKSDGNDATPSDFHNDPTLWSNLYVSPEGLEWLKTDLKNSNGKPTFVFTHVHLYYRDKYHAVKNHEDVQRILETYGNVQVVFQGHDHGGTDTRRQAGIHYIGLKGAVEGEPPSNNAYAIVTINEDASIAIEGYEKEASRDLIGDFYIESECNYLKYDNETGAMMSKSYGLCITYCEKLECDIETQEGMHPNCDRILNEYQEITGNQPPCWNKTVFLSSEKFRGDLGGLTGADRECQIMAHNAGLTGTFKAWLSDDYSSARERLMHSFTPYVTTLGDAIAEDWSDLIDGTIQNEIYVNELGEEYPYNCDDDGKCVGIWYYGAAWTSTNSDGTSVIRDVETTTNCDNWTTPNPGPVSDEVKSKTGVVGAGYDIYSPGWWSRVWPEPHEPSLIECHKWHRLYCIEQ